MTRSLSTIYLRLFVPFSIALLLGTVAAWWIGTAVLYRTHEDRVLHQLNTAVEMVSQRSFPVAEPVLTRLGQLLNASINVFDDQGNLLFPKSADQPALMNVLQTRYLSWRASGYAERELYFTVGRREYLMLLRRPDTAWQTRYQAVMALTDLSDVHEATRRGALWLAGLAACGISLLAFLGHWIARSITVPVEELADMAGKLAVGDRAIRVSVHRQDEVGALAQSLNSMAQQLTMYEQRVAEQSRLLTLGELSAKVAHEIRNPLTAIKMQLELLEDELPESAKPRQKVLIDEVRRLELIVATTLQLGLPDKLERRPVDLNALVVEMVCLLEPQLKHRKIAIMKELDGELPKCMLDANRVKQILLNLMNNASDELLYGGQIRVSTRGVGDRGVALEVADSGAGVPVEAWDALFDQASSGKSSGFGLGLRVTRELVELHSGTIEIADSELGGALFRVTFPVGS